MPGQSVVLAVVSALVFGGADFLGGVATRQAPVVSVTATSHLAGGLTLLVVAATLPGAPARIDLIWGALSGLAGGVGLLLFYWALAEGTMSVVSPLTAAVSALVPFTVGVAIGERPSALAVAGVGCALIAILLVALHVPDVQAGTNRRIGGPALPLYGAIGSGLGFGLFFVLLAQSGETAGLWPLVAARGGSLSLYATIALAGASATPVAALRSLVVKPGVLAVAISAGVLDMAANSLYLIAVGGGMLSLIAVLASLYPVSTILLARFVLGERLAGLQWIGVVAALLAVLLIA